MKLFEEKRIEDVFNEREKNIDVFLKNIGENNIDFIVEQTKKSLEIDTKLEIDIEKRGIDHKMVKSPSGIDQVRIDYTFPIKGNNELLKYTPRKNTLRRLNVNFNPGKLVICIQTDYEEYPLDSEYENLVSNAIKQDMDYIMEQLTQIKLECEEFNKKLPEKIRERVENKRLQFIDEQKHRSALDPFQ